MLVYPLYDQGGEFLLTTEQGVASLASGSETRDYHFNNPRWFWTPSVIKRDRLIWHLQSQAGVHFDFKGLLASAGLVAPIPAFPASFNAIWRVNLDGEPSPLDLRGYQLSGMITTAFVSMDYLSDEKVPDRWVEFFNRTKYTLGFTNSDENVGGGFALYLQCDDAEGLLDSAFGITIFSSFGWR